MEEGNSRKKPEENCSNWKKIAVNSIIEKAKKENKENSSKQKRQIAVIKEENSGGQK